MDDRSWTEVEEGRHTVGSGFDDENLNGGEMVRVNDKPRRWAVEEIQQTTDGKNDGEMNGEKKSVVGEKEMGRMKGKIKGKSILKGHQYRPRPVDMLD